MNACVNECMHDCMNEWYNNILSSLRETAALDQFTALASRSCRIVSGCFWMPREISGGFRTPWEPKRGLWRALGATLGILGRALGPLRAYLRGSCFGSLFGVIFGRAKSSPFPYRNSKNWAQTNASRQRCIIDFTNSFWKGLFHLTRYATCLRQVRRI